MVSNFFFRLVLGLVLMPHFSNAFYPNEIKVVKTNTRDTVLVNNKRYKKSFVGFTNHDSLPAFVSVYAKDGVDFSNGSEMLKTALAGKESGKEKAFAIWKLCSAVGFHFEFPYSSNLPDNIQPKALVNFPFFMCGEKAGIVCNLAAAAGLNARIVSLDGHVVTEIFYDGKWHMFDADENIIFLDDNGDVLSVSELAAQPDRIQKKHATLLPENDFNGFRNYKKYMLSYLKDSTLRYNYPCHADSTNWSMEVRLNKFDTLRYDWSKSSGGKRVTQSRFDFHTMGNVIRSLANPEAALSKLTDTVFLFNEELPYYIKKVQVLLPDTAKLNMQPEIVVYNRVAGKEITLPLLRSTKRSNAFEITFNAPASEHIYYHYRLKLGGASEAQVRKMRVKTSFEFNSLTFPFIQSDKVIVESTQEKNSR